MEFPKVCVITLNWNRKNDTIECIESLRRLNYPNYEILMVDNGSTDGSAEAVRERFPEVRVIRNKRNLGYAAGFNKGMAQAYAAGADYFLIINNDTVIDPEALMELCKTAQTHEDAGFVSGKVYFYNEPTRLQTAGRLKDTINIAGEHVGFRKLDLGQYEVEQEFEFIDDVFLLVKKDVYEKVGGYDENFFLYWEETDWCARVRRAGFKIFYTPGAKIWHKGNLTVSDGMTPSALYYLSRNKIIFMWRNAQIRNFLFFSYLLASGEFPMTIARFIRHRKFKYLMPYIMGHSAGYLWAFRTGMSRVRSILSGLY